MQGHNPFLNQVYFFVYTPSVGLRRKTAGHNPFLNQVYFFPVAILRNGHKIWSHNPFLNQVYFFKVWSKECFLSQLS